MNLCDQYRQMHAEGNFNGYSLLKHTDEIASLVFRHKAKTLLDYGCGKGLQYTEKNAHSQWGGIMPDLYDPYVAAYANSSALEKRYSGILCTDVFEHLDSAESVQALAESLWPMAEEFIYATICTRPAKKSLPDGRNCHLLVKNQEWWLANLHPSPESWDKIEENFFSFSYPNLRTYPYFYVRFTE